MKFLELKSWLPPGRIVWLVLGAAALAYIDGRYLATDPFLSGIWRTFVRPALFLGVLLCLSALYADGAAPREPRDRARHSAAFRLTVVIALVFGLGLDLLDLLQPFQPESKTVSWSGAGENGTHSSFSSTYPVFTEASEVAAFAVSLAISVSLYAMLLLSIFAPACMMRFGRHGLIRQSWRAFRTHWFSIGLRAMVGIPILVIAAPVVFIWQVDNWHVGLTATPEQWAKIRAALDIYDAVGVDSIAYSAFATIALLGIFLWWVGRSTGVLLDRPE